MGVIVWECDNQIAGLLDLLNLRFGPSMQVTNPEDRYGGIVEMVQLQKEFKIFRKGRSLRDCVNVLGLAGFQSARAHNRWLDLLDRIPNQEEIVERIRANLKSDDPKPMFFKAVGAAKGRPVLLAAFTQGRPLPYSREAHIIVSIPMAPIPPDAPPDKPARRAKARRGR